MDLVKWNESDPSPVCSVQWIIKTCTEAPSPTLAPCATHCRPSFCSPPSTQHKGEHLFQLATYSNRYKP